MRAETVRQQCGVFVTVPLFVCNRNGLGGSCSEKCCDSVNCWDGTQCTECVIILTTNFFSV